jgi:predicted GH43/DUF377 family glycosyl hydrolase
MFIVFSVLLVLVGLTTGLTIHAQPINSLEPAISSLKGNSVFRYNYNAAYLPLFNGASIIDALLVRVQDITNASDPYSVGPSKIALAVRQGTFNPASFSFSHIAHSSVVLEPSSPADELGTEDPRVAYDPLTKTYYLFYTAVTKNSDGSVSANLALASATDPTTASGWTR